MQPEAQNTNVQVAQSKYTNHGEMLEEGESVVCVVRRHPIGIIIIYLEALVGIVALLAFGFLVFSSFVSSLSDSSYRLVLAGIVLAVAFLVFILFVATYVYRQSRLLVTNMNLIQIVQRSLFSRKVSRLSMANVEDVSAEQRGILATILNYGTITVQTAGEQENFIFYYCPDPNKYTQEIINAHQAYANSLKENK